MGDADPFDSFSPGDSASIERTVTADDVDRFADLTGDDNPLHTSDRFAAGTGTGGRVVHGMLTAGFVSTLIGTKLPGPGALWLSQSFRFVAPVRIGDRVRVEGVVRRVSKSTRVMDLEVTVANQNDAIVLEGEARVHVLEQALTRPAPRRRPASAVVTGGGRGIGAAIAARLAADGLAVVVNYRCDDSGAAATVKAIEAAGGIAAAVQADVTDPEAVQELVARAAEMHGPVDVLVANAGARIERQALLDTRWEHVQAALDAHLRGAFLPIMAVLPGMVERRQGRVVCLSSQSAYGVPPARMAAYATAKAALSAFTRCVAAEASPFGVTANVVAPGMVDTDLVADVPQRAKLAVAAQSPNRRLTTAEDVADVVSFLAGPGGAAVTGQTMHLSGGMVMP